MIVNETSADNVLLLTAHVASGGLWVIISSNLSDPSTKPCLMKIDCLLCEDHTDCALKEPDFSLFDTQVIYFWLQISCDSFYIA